MKYYYLPALLFLLYGCKNTGTEAALNPALSSQTIQDAIKTEEAYYKEMLTKDSAIVVEKQSVKFYNTVNDQYGNVLLVEKAKSIDTLDGREEGGFELTVTAFTSDKGAYDKKLWEIKDNQSTGSGVWFNFYEAVKYGCCGADDTFSFYDLNNGQYQFSYTVKEPMVANNNYPAEGLIAYLSKRSMMWNNKYGSKTIGFLYYYQREYKPEKRQLKKYTIETDENNPDLIWSPTLKVLIKNSAVEAYAADSLPLVHLKGSHLLLLEYSDELKLFIPVENKLPLIEQAISKGADFIIRELE